IADLPPSVAVPCQSDALRVPLLRSSGAAYPDPSVAAPRGSTAPRVPFRSPKTAGANPSVAGPRGSTAPGVLFRSPKTAGANPSVADPRGSTALRVPFRSPKTAGANPSVAVPRGSTAPDDSTAGRRPLLLQQSTSGRVAPVAPDAGQSSAAPRERGAHRRRWTRRRARGSWQHSQ